MARRIGIYPFPFIVSIQLYTDGTSYIYLTFFTVFSCFF